MYVSPSHIATLTVLSKVSPTDKTVVTILSQPRVLMYKSVYVPVAS